MALRRDPLLTKLRETSDFTQLLSIAKTCQDDFLLKRDQTQQ